ncbi:MAG: hypothetical protein GEU88_11215 [Solirubrobacterales bacterium]|nr:hypothetical protein [Solirubrobacterales bacterium]
MLDAFQLPFMQRAALEVLLLAPLAAILGTQIVLRRLAFYTHGIGSATFPGLVVAGPAGIPPALAALAAGFVFAAGLERLGRLARIAHDAATALLLVGALAIGTVLASDVFESGAGVDQLLFGSLLAIGDSELAISAAVLVLVAITAVGLRRTWIAAGFDSDSSRALGLRVGLADAALLVAIALAVVAALDAVGALLVGSVLVIPAATARLFARSVGSLEALAAAVALVEGLAGLVLAYELDVPPGAAIAVIGGGAFALCALARPALSRLRAGRPAGRPA